MKTIVFAGGLALLGTLLGTRLAIRFLVKKGYGQLIRDDGPTSHHVKRGTPTMGGLVIIAAVLVAYFGSHLLTWTGPSASALLILFLFTGLGAVGQHITVLPALDMVLAHKTVPRGDAAVSHEQFMEVVDMVVAARCAPGCR